MLALAKYYHVFLKSKGERNDIHTHFLKNKKYVYIYVYMYNFLTFLPASDYTSSTYKNLILQ